MVSLVCWNTRGLNGLNKKKEVKLLCSSLGIRMVYFLETRIKTNKLKTLLTTYLVVGFIILTTRIIIMGGLLLYGEKNSSR
ncbi:hypothetical protein P3S67_012808 [Capsicum chacoense]